jgi:hypothetical protein
MRTVREIRDALARPVGDAEGSAGEKLYARAVADGCRMTLRWVLGEEPTDAAMNARSDDQVFEATASFEDLEHGEPDSQVVRERELERAREMRERYHKGQLGSFFTHLFDAISHADPINRRRLLLAFPAHVEAFDEWQSSPEVIDA